MRISSHKTYMLVGQILAAILAGDCLANVNGDNRQQTSASAQAPAITPPAFNAAVPEGKTLPDHVARLRWVHRFYEASSGYDAQGHSSDLGLSYRAAVNALVGEVALSERLSLRFMAPFFYRNSTSLDHKKFKQSALYKAKYLERITKAASELRKTKLCKTTEQCLSFIERGESLPFSRDVFLDSGEHFSLTAGTPIRQAIEERLLNAATPPNEGALGLGDIETGLLYNAYRSDRILLSGGLGLRLPTGDFQVPETRRPTSGGVADVGLRFNADFALAPGLWISLQEQVERAVTKATWQRPSDLDNTSFNLAHPDDGGDGQANSRVYEKRGFSVDSLLKANYGLGSLTTVLKPLAMSLSYQNRQDRPVYLDGKEHKKAANLDWVGVGATASGLAYQLPVELELNYAQPVRGKNARLAATTTETSVKIYTRF